MRFKSWFRDELAVSGNLKSILPIEALLHLLAM